MQTTTSERMEASSFIYLHKSRKAITKNLLIFKTNIDTNNKVIVLSKILNEGSSIIKWSIDNEDIDNVLRIETDGCLTERDIITLTNKHGFFCELLND